MKFSNLSEALVGPFDMEARVLTENVPVSVSENSSSFIFVIFFSCDTILIIT